MNSAQIEQYLGFLGEKLAEMQVKTSLILLGGALMVTQFGNRKATQDIDVVIATNDRRTYQAVQQAVGLVAREKKLQPTWLNDDVTIVVDQVGKPQTPKHWKTFRNLTCIFQNSSTFSLSNCFPDAPRMIATFLPLLNGYLSKPERRPGLL
jgi:hypothetical protein